MPTVVSDEFSYSHLLGLLLGDGSVDEEAQVSLRLIEWGGGRWPELFPHARPGRDHDLEPWQQGIVDREPEAFLRGLIQSDGYRVINRFTTKLRSGRVAEYAYPRYFFSNESPGVRGLFCASCERIDVDWTQSNRRTISIANRRSVARLDEVIGTNVWRGDDGGGHGS